MARPARRELEQLPDEIAGRILERIEDLAAQPRPPGVVILIGGKNLWRIRVGDDRVVYVVDDAQRLVDISIIRHRREVYRGLWEPVLKAGGGDVRRL